MLRFFIVTVVMVVLPGCQGFYEKNIKGNTSSPYFLVPVDSTIMLKREITIPANRDRTYIVNGQLRRWQDVDIYQPYCMLQVATAKSVPQTVKPAEFVVQKVSQETIYQLALLGPTQIAQLDRDGGVMEYKVVATVMELFSQNEPEVTKMICGGWGLPADMPHITINSIYEQLDGVFELTLATDEMQRNTKMRRSPDGSGMGY